MAVETVGVVGAGQMGNGIAHVMALAGYKVLLNDIDQEALDKGIATVRKNLDRQVSRGKISAAERDAALARIVPTLTLSDLGQTDLVIEAATERETVKQAIFEDLLPHLKPETILTSNTSSISITRLAEPHRPAREVHGLPLHEPGAGDATGRADPRHRHRPGHLRRLPRSGRAARQDRGTGGGFPRASSSTAS